MKKIVFIVEKTGTGFSAYAESDAYPVSTTASNMEELKVNMLDAINTYMDMEGLPELTQEDLTIKLDLPQFFEYYKVINARWLSKRVGMNETLLSQYVNGTKEPSAKQTEKILAGIRSLGRELANLDFA